jgi:hypothetical protein
MPLQWDPYGAVEAAAAAAPVAHAVLALLGGPPTNLQVVEES